MEGNAADARAQVEKFQERFKAMAAEMHKVVVGYGDVIDDVLATLFASGNVLLEGVPGLGKTMLVKTLADVAGLEFSRIQFTPDLMPADIVGTNVVHESDEGEKMFRFQKGPVFANIVLADEINRATPKTQSALLEAMQEKSVTVGGTTYQLDPPFFVLGTQNPIEMEGTYPLPEAQVDRFLLKLQVKYLGEDELVQIVDRTTSSEKVTPSSPLTAEDIFWMQGLVRDVLIADHVKRYAIRLVLATHPENEHATEMVNRFVRYGSSPRGIQSIILTAKVRALLDGRFNVSCNDVRRMAMQALRHRVILNFEGEAEEITTDQVIAQIMEQVAEVKE